jgi:RDD family.
MDPEAKRPSIHIEYVRPLFHRRIFAYLLDFFIMLMLFGLLFLGARAIGTAIPESQKRSARMNQARDDSGLYVYYDNQYSLISTYYTDHGTTTDNKTQLDDYQQRMDKFIAYIRNDVGGDKADIIQADYDAYLLGKDYQGVAYFVKDSAGKVTLNSACTATYGLYNKNVLVPYINDHAEGYFTIYAPHFVEDTHYFSYVLLFYEIPPCVFLASVLTFYVPGLFFRRGRQTLGRFLYKIGRVDSSYLAIGFWRYTAESAIFTLGIITLSLFTLAIPLIISFSLMAWSKKKQGFAEYMLGIQDVDLTDSKIYWNFQEIELEMARKEERPIQFETPEVK